MRNMSLVDMNKLDPVFMEILRRATPNKIAKDIRNTFSPPPWIGPKPEDKDWMVFKNIHKIKTRNNSKKPWKLKDTHTDRLVEQKKIKAQQIEYFKKNRVIDERLVAQRKQLREIREYLEKGD